MADKETNEDQLFDTRTIRGLYIKPLDVTVEIPTTKIYHQDDQVRRDVDDVKRAFSDSINSGLTFTLYSDNSNGVSLQSEIDEHKCMQTYINFLSDYCSLHQLSFGRTNSYYPAGSTTAKLLASNITNVELEELVETMIGLLTDEKDYNLAHDEFVVDHLPDPDLVTGEHADDDGDDGLAGAGAKI